MKRISGYEIAAARRDIANVYGETVTVLRGTRTSDSKGGWTTSYATAIQVAGRLGSVSNNKEKYATRLGSSPGYFLTLPRTITLRGTDRVRVRGIVLEPAVDENDVPLRIAGRWLCKEVTA